MMELGEESIHEHELLIQLIQQFTWKEVVLVGGDFKLVQHPYRYCNNSLEAKEWLLQQNFQNSYFLIKGSRSMAMEKIIEK